MIQRVVPGKSRLNVDAQTVLHGLLTHVFPQTMGAKALLHRTVLFPEASGH